MLSDKARTQIFGLAFESIFEAGQALEILNEIQNDSDDFPLAIHAFKTRWQRVINILIQLGAWITQDEASELVPIFLKTHKITNDEIWREVVLTDQTIYMWTQNAVILSKKYAELAKEEKDRIALIKAIISSHMIDTKVHQEKIMRKRERFVFQQELIVAARRMASFHLKTNPEELKKILLEEFPLLADTELNHVDIVYESILAKYVPVELEMADIVEEDELEQEKLTDEDVDIDEMFESIQLPPMETKESIALPSTDGKSMEVSMEPKVHEVSPKGIAESLKKLIPDFSVNEIQERALEELRNFKKHGRDLNRLDVLWQILKLAEKKLQQEFDREIDTDEMNKIGKILNAISMYKIEIGNDQKHFKNVKYVFKVQ